MNKAADGIIDLKFLERNGRTIAKVYHKGNSRVSSAIQTQDMKVPYYFLISTGGGFIEGEHYQVDIDVAAKAHAILTTQTPTYIYKCDRRGLTVQKTQIDIADSGILEYYADEVIPYKDADYQQETYIRMDKEASLIYFDGLTAGWSPDGSSFQYRKVGLRTEIELAGELVFKDYLICAPEQEKPQELGLFEGYEAFDSVVVIDKLVDEQLIGELRNTLEKIDFAGIYGISKLDTNGFVLRILGQSGSENRKISNACIKYFREEKKRLEPLQLRKNGR